MNASEIKFYLTLCLILTIGNVRSAHADTEIDGTATSSTNFTLNGAVNISTLTVTSLSISTITAVSSATIANLTALNSLTVPNGTNSTDAAAFGQIPVSHYPQIPVYFSENTGKTTTSTSFVDTLASISITPTTSSSKVKICFGGPFTSGGAQNCFFGIKRGSTQLIVHDNSPFIADASGTSEMSGCWLDSPSTTSSTTYTIELAAQVSNTCSFGSTAATGAGTWILLEEVK